MALPVSTDDQMKVQKTFDEEAGPVRIHPRILIKKYIYVVKQPEATSVVCLLRQDDRLNAKELRKLFNSGSTFSFYNLIFKWLTIRDLWLCTSNFGH